MLRTTVSRRALSPFLCLRTAAAPQTKVARPFSSICASTAARPTARAAQINSGSFVGQRRYAAAAGLKKEEVESRVMGVLAGFDKVNDPQNIKPDAHFANDLGLDSLDTVEVVMAVEEEFSLEIPDKEADAIHSVDKAVEYILSQPDAV